MNIYLMQSVDYDADFQLIRFLISDSEWLILRSRFPQKLEHERCLEVTQAGIQESKFEVDKGDDGDNLDDVTRHRDNALHNPRQLSKTI